MCVRSFFFSLNAGKRNKSPHIVDIRQLLNGSENGKMESCVEPTASTETKSSQPSNQHSNQKQRRRSRHKLLISHGVRDARRWSVKWVATHVVGQSRCSALLGGL